MDGYSPFPRMLRSSGLSVVAFSELNCSLGVQFKFDEHAFLVLVRLRYILLAPIWNLDGEHWAVLRKRQ